MTKPTKQPTPRTMARKLRTLARQMRRMGAEMEWYGGFNAQIVEKALQVYGAAGIVESWADGMANKEGGR